MPKPIAITGPDDIPYDSIRVNQVYILRNSTAEQRAEIRRRIAASPAAYGHPIIMIAAPGTEDTMRVHIAPCRDPDITPAQPTPKSKPKGRPVGDLTHALSLLMVDDVLPVNCEQKPVVNIRAHISGRAQAWKRKFTCQLIKTGDPRVKDWTPEFIMAADCQQLLLVTRTR